MYKMREGAVQATRQLVAGKSEMYTIFVVKRLTM
jgi:hypothetical protein